jgi:hypothetical protein
MILDNKPNVKYKTVKTSLKAIMKNIYINKVNKLVIKCNNIVSDIYQFIKLYVLYLYKNNKTIPDLNKKFIFYVLRTLCKKKNVGSKINNKIFDKLQKFYSKHFKPIYNHKQHNTVGMSNLLRYISEEVDTSIKNNISLYFVKRLYWFIKYSNKLPWFRGDKIESETQFLIDTTRDILQKSNCVISLDIHSGFGFKDQLWFPFAYSKKAFSNLNEMFLFFQLFEKTNPHHIYKIEPQSQNYLTHGDIWDYCFLNFKKSNQVYIPLTLEMGSWLWVKKNPVQIFSKIGLFNPIKEHRLNRTFRRHRPFFEFILQALFSSPIWTNSELNQTEFISEKARQRYYARS